jgi:hypothetical protein
VLDDQLAVQILKDCGVAGGIGEGEVEGCGGTVGLLRRDDSERIVGEPGDGFGDVGVIIEDVLRPETNCVRRVFVSSP